MHSVIALFVVLHFMNIDLQANLADHTDNQWATCFQDSAEQLLGISAKDLGEIKDTVRIKTFGSFTAPCIRNKPRKNHNI